ncbi:DUF4142 domain-containing protein [Spirosoma agri]|uniref:DUF4142 domain-containing protein n=1 Tax=Spirosoma agri TaxID=1987381 RepID=A0A6M0IL61_9BACT|nr:DUF4142 domain-containing protein [Spirosoma agri]NEU69030.1 DUF4142 domain-containing protein [Spirosoma agri]
MKPTTVLALVIGTLLTTFSCSSGDGSTDKADKINDERIDKQAIAVSNDAKEDAKKVSRYIVHLSNSGMTEYELSKVALQKATNPEVRGFAQRAMNEHQQNDKSLQTLAKQMNVTLPVGLSDKSKNALEKLTGMDKGTEFDLQYLDTMATMNDDALDVADDLQDLAPNDGVKTYTKKLLENDSKHRDLAKQLKNVLN